MSKALLLLLLAAGPSLAPTAPGPRRSEDAERLERALEKIRVPALRADLDFLADDELRGRDTPSEGLRTAALFLATRLGRLGFQSAGSGDFYYRWSLSRTGLDLDASGLWVQSTRGETRLVPVRDYFLARMSHGFAQVVEGGVVSVGDGSKEEFEESDLEGSWALLADHGLSARRAQRYAEKAGAVGILFCQVPETERDYASSFAAANETLAETRVQYRPSTASRHRDEVPYVMVAPTGVEALLREAPTPGETPPAGTRLPLHVREERVLHDEDIEVVNVAGFWPGRDERLAHEVIIVSAHYDHVGVRGGKIYNGADDNASGTTGLLAVAEALAAYGPMRRSILLLWVAGEEEGLWGSDAWTRAPQLPEGCVPVADLNIDMIGRTRKDELYLTPTEEHPSFNRVAQAAYDLSPLEGFPTLASQDADWARSDHFNFDRNLGIPVAFLSAGEHADYHQPTDTAEKIDYDKLARITRLVVRMLDRLEDGPLR